MRKFIFLSLFFLISCGKAAEIQTVTVDADIPKTTSPVFTIPAGDYETAQTIEISGETTDLTIRYTDDGSTPSSSYGKFYTGPITFTDGIITLKAVAYKEGSLVSDVVSATYLIGTLRQPSFSLPGGVYGIAQNLVLTPENEGAKVFYTVDGTHPACDTATEYTAPIVISSSQSVRAISCKTGFTPSLEKEELYYIGVTGVTLPPSFTVAEGTYQAPFSVVITVSTPGTTVRYTVDGQNPTSSSGILYDPALSTPIEITQTTLLKAIAYRDSYSSSLVTASQYRLKVKTPSFSKAGSTYLADQTVDLASETAGAAIYYTTDGSIPVPGENGTLYTGSIPMSQSVILKAIAVKDGWDYSDVAESSYTLKVVDPLVTLTPDLQSNGTLGLKVSFSSTTPSAQIVYTSDESQPSLTHGTVYTGPLFFSSGFKLKVMAFKPGCQGSETVTCEYVLPALLPTVSYSSSIFSVGTFSGVVGGGCGTDVMNSTGGLTSLTLSYPDVSGVTIRYTLNGSDPTETNGTVYSGSVIVPNTGTYTLKVRAFKAGYQPSPVQTMSVTVTYVYIGV